MMSVTTTKSLENEKDKPTVLAIGAHPDDFEVGCAGTLSLLIKWGYDVYGLTLTNGEMGGDGDVRVKEAKIAAETLGLKGLFFANLKDGKLDDHLETVDLIEGYIRKINPKMVFTHYDTDVHQDHRYTANACISAARNVTRLLLYETPTTKEFFPHTLQDITPEIHKKLDVLTKHQSQIDKGVINLEVVKSVAMFRGNWGGNYNRIPYAEAFNTREVSSLRVYPRHLDIGVYSNK